MKYPKPVLLLLAALLLACPAMAKPVTWHINDSRNVVRFSSDAPVELITGSTNKLQGTVTYDDSFQFDKKHPFAMSFSVDLASIDTGIPLRDEHMRNNFLHTEQFPKATFTVKSVKTKNKPTYRPGEVTQLSATGDFTLHGKTAIKTIPLKITYFPESEITHKRFPAGDMIRIQGTFPVRLAEHGIQRPEAVLVKLAETVYVTVDAFASNASPAKP